MIRYKSSSYKTKCKYNFQYKIGYNYRLVLIGYNNDNCTENGYYFLKEKYDHFGSSQYIF